MCISCVHGSVQDTSWADQKKRKVVNDLNFGGFFRVLLEGNVRTHGLAKMVTSCKSFAI